MYEDLGCLSYLHAVGVICVIIRTGSIRSHNISLFYGRPKNYVRSGVLNHWRSPHYAVTHAPNKNSNIQERSPNVVKVIFHAIRNFS